MMTCARWQARVPQIVLALATLLLPSLALSSPASELVGKLTSEACWQLVSASPSQAKAILSDAAKHYADAESELRTAQSRAAVILTRAPESEVVEILAHVELARRKYYAFRTAFWAIRGCYDVVAQSAAQLSGDVVRTTKGIWKAGCMNTGSSAIVANATGTFLFNLVNNGTLYGEYREDDGPSGAIRGSWQRRSNGTAVGGSASAGLADTVGTWKGILGDAGGGNGDVQVTKRALDLNCAGQWIAE